MTVRLSKSKIMSSLQCLKRVYLEINRKDLIHYSKSTEAAFALGHEVGDIAVQLYGGPHSDGRDQEPLRGIRERARRRGARRAQALTRCD